ncbi:MAG: hypothetical protein KAT90_11020 [Gammaproteobacteria bacterium]|nr:hypothetical protein [Gammaproteobacteria bacterium]
MYLRGLFLLVITLVITGCGGGIRLDSPDNDNASLVFGYIDMSDAPSDLAYVRMMRIRPDISEERGAAIHDGMFVSTWQTPGSYKFVSFGGYYNNGLNSISYRMPAQGKNEIDPVIKKPGAHFLGSYKYVKTEDNGFDLVRVQQPTEKTLLLKIKEYSTHPYWTSMIDNRLKEL